MKLNTNMWVNWEITLSYIQMDTSTLKTAGTYSVISDSIKIRWIPSMVFFAELTNRNLLIISINWTYSKFVFASAITGTRINWHQAIYSWNFYFTFWSQPIAVINSAHIRTVAFENMGLFNTPFCSLKN